MKILGIATMIGGIGKVSGDLLLSEEERLKIALQQQTQQPTVKSETVGLSPEPGDTADSAYLCTTQVFSNPDDLSRIWADDN